MKKEKSDYIVQTVLHALDVLEQFNGSVDELGVTDLSKRLRLHKNNVFRLLATLESRNYIEQNRHTENYRLGLKTMELGQSVIRQMGLLRRSRPVLESLARTFNETCSVAVLRDGYIIHLDAVESTHPLRVAPRVASRLPTHCTAAGKVLLADLVASGKPLPSTLGELVRHAPKTIVDRHEFERELAKVTAHGYALEADEADVGVRGVAAPIRNFSGNVVGALCISGPVMRFDEARMLDEMVPAVKKAADEISVRLGYCQPADMAVNS